MAWPILGARLVLVLVRPAIRVSLSPYSSSGAGVRHHRTCTQTTGDWASIWVSLQVELAVLNLLLIQGKARMSEWYISRNKISVRSLNEWDRKTNTTSQSTCIYETSHSFLQFSCNQIQVLGLSPTSSISSLMISAGLMFLGTIQKGDQKDKNWKVINWKKKVFNNRDKE